MENQTRSSSMLVDFVFEKKTTSSAPSKRFTISVTFRTTTNTWICHHQNQTLTQTRSTTRLGHKHIDLYTTMDPATMHETIAAGLVLSEECLPQHLRQEVIDRAFQSTAEMIRRNLTSSAVCKFQLTVDHYIHDYGDVMDRIIQQSFDEESVRKMVPASDSSIKALLKRTVIIADDDKTCSVCLEDFPAGSQVLCMPCSHSFHQDCITKWLTTSHFCPNCRYKMPVGNK